MSEIYQLLFWQLNCLDISMVNYLICIALASWFVIEKDKCVEIRNLVRQLVHSDLKH
jgi:hypothetical protein